MEVPVEALVVVEDEAAVGTKLLLLQISYYLVPSICIIYVYFVVNAIKLV